MARNFVVTVKESGNGQPWLLVEPNENIGLTKGQHIVMHLPDGTGIERAEEVAKLLNQYLLRFRIERF